MSELAPQLVPLRRQPARLVVPGENLRKQGVNLFRCPVCRNEFRHDDEYEPLCTGPHPSLDEHEPAVMVKVDVEGDPRLQIVVPGPADVTSASVSG